MVARNATADIPDELLLHIFRHLVEPQERMRLLRVCQQWRRVAVDRALWRSTQTTPLRDAIILTHVTGGVASTLRLSVEVTSLDAVARAAALGFPLDGLARVVETLYVAERTRNMDNLATLLAALGGGVLSRLVLTNAALNVTMARELLPLLPHLRHVTVTEHYGVTLGATGLLPALMELADCELRIHPASRFYLQHANLPQAPTRLRAFEAPSGYVRVSYEQSGVFRDTLFPHLERIVLPCDPEKSLFGEVGPVPPALTSLTLHVNQFQSCMKLTYPRLRELTLFVRDPHNPHGFDHDPRGFATQFPCLAKFTVIQEVDALRWVEPLLVAMPHLAQINVASSADRHGIAHNNTAYGHLFPPEEGSLAVPVVTADGLSFVLTMTREAPSATRVQDQGVAYVSYRFGRVVKAS